MLVLFVNDIYQMALQKIYTHTSIHFTEAVNTTNWTKTDKYVHPHIWQLFWFSINTSSLWQLLRAIFLLTWICSILKIKLCFNTFSTLFSQNKSLRSVLSLILLEQWKHYAWVQFSIVFTVFATRYIKTLEHYNNNIWMQPAMPLRCTIANTYGIAKQSSFYQFTQL